MNGSSIALPLDTSPSQVRRQRHAKTSWDLDNRVCAVCGDKAENYNFGQVTCESCKAFFRRNAHRISGVKCSKGSGECSISIEGRKSCPPCRLNKCFSVGMNPHLIRCVPSKTPSGVSKTSFLTSSGSECSNSDLDIKRERCDSVDTPVGPSTSAPINNQLKQGASSTSSASSWEGRVLLDPAHLQLTFHRHLISNWTTPQISGIIATRLEQLTSALEASTHGTISPVIYHPGSLRDIIVSQVLSFLNQIMEIMNVPSPCRTSVIKLRLPGMICPAILPLYRPETRDFKISLGGGQQLVCRPIDELQRLLPPDAVYLISALGNCEAYIGQLHHLSGGHLDVFTAFSALKCFTVGSDSNHLGPVWCGLSRELEDQCMVMLFGTLALHFPSDAARRLDAFLEQLVWARSIDHALGVVVDNADFVQAVIPTTGS